VLGEMSIVIVGKLRLIDDFLSELPELLDDSCNPRLRDGPILGDGGSDCSIEAGIECFPPADKLVFNYSSIYQQI